MLKLLFKPLTLLDLPLILPEVLLLLLSLLSRKPLFFLPSDGRLLLSLLGLLFSLELLGLHHGGSLFSGLSLILAHVYVLELCSLHLILHYSLLYFLLSLPQHFLPGDPLFFLTFLSNFIQKFIKALIHCFLLWSHVAIRLKLLFKLAEILRHLLVQGLFRRVLTQHIVGLLDQSELLGELLLALIGGLLIHGGIRMVLEGQLAELGLDGLLARVGLAIEDLVVVVQSVMLPHSIVVAIISLVLILCAKLGLFLVKRVVAASPNIFFIRVVPLGESPYDGNSLATVYGCKYVLFQHIDYCG